MPAEGDPGTGELRASDADRDRVLSRLQDGLVSGMINIDEFNERSEQALRARTRAELATLTADLPAGDLLAGDRLAGDGPAPPDDLVVLRGASSSLKRNGQWRVPRTLVIEQRRGSSELDFTQALIRHQVVEIALDVSWGSVEMRLPEGASVSLDDIEAIRSSVQDHRRNAPVTGQPHFVITGTVQRASVEIRGPRRKLFRRGKP